MARSFWKGKYIPNFILINIAITPSYTSLISKVRNIFLFKQLLGRSFLCYQGCEFKIFHVTRGTLFLKLSSFIVTRQFGIVHIPKKTKKQKELEEKKRSKTGKIKKLSKSRTTKNKNITRKKKKS